MGESYYPTVPDGWELRKQTSGDDELALSERLTREVIDREFYYTGEEFAEVHVSYGGLSDQWLVRVKRESEQPAATEVDRFDEYDDGLERAIGLMETFNQLGELPT